MNLTAELITSLVSCAVSSGLGGALTYLIAKWKKNSKRTQALEEGVKSLLRNNLIDSHDRYTSRGYCPIYAKESVRHCYDSYHALGGNGVVTKLYEDIMELPEAPAEEEPPRA